jgi:hypothetical protein
MFPTHRVSRYDQTSFYLDQVSEMHYVRGPEVDCEAVDARDSWNLFPGTLYPEKSVSMLDIGHGDPSLQVKYKGFATMLAFHGEKVGHYPDQ